MSHLSISIPISLVVLESSIHSIPLTSYHQLAQQSHDIRNWPSIRKSWKCNCLTGHTATRCQSSKFQWQFRWDIMVSIIATLSTTTKPHKLHCTLYRGLLGWTLNWDLYLPVLNWNVIWCNDTLCWVVEMPIAGSPALELPPGIHSLDMPLVSGIHVSLVYSCFCRSRKY